MRKWVIPDIRGDITLLKKLLQRIGPTADDQLIFTGSYLGPGPDSKAVVDHIIELQKTLPNIALLRGCYEYMFGFCIETKPTVELLKLWMDMGGSRVFHSYASGERLIVIKPHSNGKPRQLDEAEIPLRIPASHLELFARLHQWFEDDIYPYVVTHCGGHPLLFGGAMDNEMQTIFAEADWWLQDGRRIPNKTVIFSHSPFEKPFRRAGKLGIDLGAGFGGKLCCFEMFEDKLTIVE